MGSRMNRINPEEEDFIVSRPLLARHDSSEDGSGRQTLVVSPIDMRQAMREFKARDCHQPGAGFGQEGDPAFTLSGGPVQAIAFHGTQDPDVSGDVTHPLGRNQGLEVCVLQGRWRGDDGRGYDRPPHVSDLPSLDAHKVDLVAFMAGQSAKAGSVAASETLSPTLRSNGGGLNTVPSVSTGQSVRRLTPRECERLQGFPDDYTLITYKGKPAKDGPRYRVIGNSMAVPVMRWIGERIEAVSGLDKTLYCSPFSAKITTLTI